MVRRGREGEGEGEGERLFTNRELPPNAVGGGSAERGPSIPAKEKKKKKSRRRRR